MKIKILFCLLFLSFISVNYASAQDLERAWAVDLDPKLISNPYYNYVPSKTVRNFPAPAVVFNIETTKEDKQEILDKLIYPAMNKTGLPVAAFIIESTESSTNIAITVVRFSGYITATLVERKANRHFDTEDYVLLLEEASIYDDIGKPKPRKTKQKRKTPNFNKMH